VNLNLRIKSYVSRVLLYLLVLFMLFTFLLSICCIRSSLLSISLVMMILLTIVLVGRLSYSALYTPALL
jgi:succinate-acetate transporter protein